MICNIIDRRVRIYRWKAITAIVEATYHDNSCADSDIAAESVDAIVYDERASISLADAVLWAQSMSCDVTLYLYDQGKGISTVSRKETEHFQESGNR
jgi:hypothetical protein